MLFSSVSNKHTQNERHTHGDINTMTLGQTDTQADEQIHTNTQLKNTHHAQTYTDTQT